MSKWLRTLSTKAKTSIMVAGILAAQVVGATAPFIPNKASAAQIIPTAPTVTTQVSQSSIALGQSVNDVATLSGTNGAVNGTVSFFVCGPTLINLPCVLGLPVGTPKTIVGGQASSSSFTPLFAGDYCFLSVYTPSAGAGYLFTTHTNTSTECFTATLGGSITVTKVVSNTNGGTAIASQFPLFVNNTQVTTGASNTFSSGQSYTVSENGGPAGYTQTSAACIDDTTHHSIAGTTFTLLPLHHVSCTITNSDIAPTLTLLDTVNAGSGGTATSANFQGQINGTNVSWGAANTESASTPYTLSQVVLPGGAGYSASAWVCDNGFGTLVGGNITLTVGEHVTCTITNTPIAPQLTVIKHVVGGTAVASNFTMNVTGTSVSTPSFPGSETGTTVTLDAGTYSVSESGGPAGYTTTMSGDCTNVTIALGQSNTCTITNTRDTGVIRVTKNLVPATDNGRFALLIDGGATSATSIGNNGTTGNVSELTGTHSVSEVAAANSPVALSDYDSSYICTDGFTVVAIGNGTTTTNFNVAKNQAVNCVFTNVRHAHVTIVKDAQPDSSQAFDFTLSDLFNNSQNFSLVDDGTNTNNSHTSSLSSGIYTVKESALAGWDLNNISCNAIVLKNVVAGTVTFLVLPGQNLTCTFTNVRQTGDVSVTNVLVPAGDPGEFNLQVDGVTKAANVGNGGTTGPIQVFTGTHTLSETAGTGTTFANYVTTYSCTNGLSGTGTSVTVTVTKNATVGCTFTNTHNTGSIRITKQLVPANDNGRFNLVIDGNTGSPAATNVGDNGTTGNVTVQTGTHHVSEVAAATSPTSLSDYDSGYICTDGFFIVAIGTGTTTSNFTVVKNHTVNCVFTNVRHATITVTKDALPTSSQAFNFTLTRVTIFPVQQFTKHFSLVDNGSTSNSEATGVSTGTYVISEAATADWDLTGISCNAPVIRNLLQGTVIVTVFPGQLLNCTYTNTHQTGTVSVTNVLFPANDPGKFNLQVDGITVTADAGNGGTTGSVTVITGTHTISETAGTSTILANYTTTYSCTNGLHGTGISTGSFTVAKGANVSCTFTNQHNVIPQVLGASTVASGPELTDTGLPILAFTLAALSLLGAALFVSSYRKPNTTK